jgi:aminoglycoside phosphotransferase (APT) family kinase protein
MTSESRLAHLVPACKRVGLDPDAAVLLRYHVNAVYRLPRANAVARMSPVKREESVRRSVQVTRWLCAGGFPATAPLDVDQPVQVDGWMVTFWRYYDAHGRSKPPPAELARLLRQLHVFDPPPFPLPTYQPLVSFLEELKTYGHRVLVAGEQDFLQNRAAELVHAYHDLASARGSGLIHGDARVGNLLWDGSAVVLGDWDTVSIGPRELDLVITYQGTRYGRSEADLDEFGKAYGWDVRTWPGYATLRDIRDLQTLGAPLRLAVDRPDVADELHHRIRGLRARDHAQQWRSF